MRVLVVTNMYPNAAASYRGVFVARQVESLRREGLDVAVEEIAGPRGPGDYLMARSRVRRRIREFGADIVHVHYGYSGAAGLAHGVPSVLTLHGSDIRRDVGLRWRHRAGSEVSRGLARLAGLVIVQNEAMKREFHGRLAARVVVMSNGIDESMFRPLPRDEARARLGLPAHELVFMFVDAGDPRRKRPDLAEAAVGRISATGRPAHLLKVSGISADEMPWYYAAADALLMTSDYEGSPMCVKEALACGTPVISVPVGDVPEVVDAPERGMIVPRDPAQLAQAGLAAVGRTGSRVSLLPEHLRSGTIARRLVKMYEQLLATRERHPG